MQIKARKRRRVSLFLRYYHHAFANICRSCMPEQARRIFGRNRLLNYVFIFYPKKIFATASKGIHLTADDFLGSSHIH